MLWCTECVASMWRAPHAKRSTNLIHVSLLYQNKPSRPPLVENRNLKTSKENRRKWLKGNIPFAKRKATPLEWKYISSKKNDGNQKRVERPSRCLFVSSTVWGPLQHLSEGTLCLQSQRLSFPLIFTLFLTQLMSTKPSVSFTYVYAAQDHIYLSSFLHSVGSG